MENNFICPRCHSALCISDAACSTCRLPLYFDVARSLVVDNVSFPDHNHAAVELAFKNGDFDFYSRDEKINAKFIHSFTLPLLRRSFSEPNIRILSVGCGIGIDVDMLVDLGYDAWGTDCGSRCLFWSKRKYPQRLVRCVDDTFPFPDNHFDFLMCHQVLEHVGVVGDTTALAENWKGRRQRFLDNLLRVTKPGGLINVATPNRLFPIDPGHAPNFMGVRLHGPFDYFLTSYGDMRRYFRNNRVSALSPLGYYAGTCCSSMQIAGRAFLLYQRFVDRFPALQGTPLNPLTNVLVRKGAA